MQEQMSLLGFGSSPKPRVPIDPTDKLFFAVMPEASAAARIRQLAQDLRFQHALRGLALPAGQLHISLFSLGNHVGLPLDLPDATAAASQLAQHAFKVQFNNVLSFRYQSRLSGGYPFVLCGDEGVIGLETLQQGLIEALSHTRFKGVRGSFKPHVTLLYDYRQVPAHTVEPIEWGVHEFVLLRRHINQNRPYSVLGRWPLRSR
ncbi:MAG: 2'-5' RNA ligase family protein [Pseudomonadota bacterium]